MMKKSLLILILIVFFCTSGLMAQEATPSRPIPTCLPCAIFMAGYITDSITGLPIEGATVVLTADAGTALGISDAEGYYQAVAASCGCMSGSVQISAEGYQSISEEVFDASGYDDNYSLVPVEIKTAAEIYFVPQTTSKVLVNLKYMDEGIPPMPTLFASGIVGDFAIENEVHINSGGQILGAYGMTINYDPSVVIVNTNKGTNGVEPGIPGFVAAVHASIPGSITISGFDVNGIGPSEDIHLFTINWLAQTYEGSTELTIIVDKFIDETTENIQLGSIGVGQINISYITCIIGDVNNDGTVNIVDALLVAQYYVGVISTGLDLDCGDVDNDGKVSIIDALLIAQYFVGLINQF